ncbi:PAC2 family protein [Candidatus Woesearchaeota archaeon]|nr:PAC2 family protein [Candidatus Woesearchaeota archaeon]
MPRWIFKKVEKRMPVLNNPVLVEGLPGIGNVGKVAADFMVDKLKAKKLYTINSYSFPHSVFVNAENLIEIPTIDIYYKRLGGKKRDILIVVGDVQPVDEESTYEFCDLVLDIVEKMKVKEVITLGGIGLSDVPKKPKVYCTGNSKELVSSYVKGTGADNKIYGVVGPIVGVSGVLLGLSKLRNIGAVSLLAETLGHPYFLGISGAKEILKVLNKKLLLGIDLKEIDKEIKSLEDELMKRTKELSDVSKSTALKKIEGKFGKDVTYIG